MSNIVKLVPKKIKKETPWSGVSYTYNVINVKPPVLKCPLSDYLEDCPMVGTYMKPSYSQKALSISKLISNIDLLLKNRPKEYAIIDNSTIFAAMPTEEVICTLKTLESAIYTVVDRTVNDGIPCYNMVLYYNHTDEDIYICIEDLHPEE